MKYGQYYTIKRKADERREWEEKILGEGYFIGATASSRGASSRFICRKGKKVVVLSVSKISQQNDNEIYSGTGTVGRTTLFSTGYGSHFHDGQRVLEADLALKLIERFEKENHKSLVPLCLTNPTQRSPRA